MQKIVSFLTIALVVTTLTTSCNKKLKDDVKDLEKSLDDQKAQQATLQDQLATLNSLATLSPLTYSITTTTDADEPFSQAGTYVYGEGSNYSSSIVDDLEDGTYGISIYRAGDVASDFSCFIYFQYNPTTKVATYPYIQVRGITAEGAGYVTFSGSSEITFTINVTAFDYSAGTISFNAAATTTTAYSSNVYTGKTMNFTSSYSGTLAKTQLLI